MKKYQISFSIFLLLANVSFSQTTKYYYFDANWNLTSGNSNYYYYRVAKFNSNGEFLNPIIDYYRNGVIQSKISTDYFVFTSGDGKIRNGSSTHFNKVGVMTGYQNYKNGRFVGKLYFNAYEEIIKGVGCTYGDCENGYGIVYFSSSGDKYEGDFSNGQLHGYGKYTWNSTGESYKGQFRNNEIYKVQYTTQDLKTGLEVGKLFLENAKLLKDLFGSSKKD